MYFKWKWKKEFLRINTNSFHQFSSFTESVLRSRSALWLSQDSKWMAFLQLNDTKVSSISYKQLGTNIDQQPRELKYAKVSKNNDYHKSFLNCKIPCPTWFTNIWIYSSQFQHQGLHWNVETLWCQKKIASLEFLDWPRSKKTWKFQIILEYMFHNHLTPWLTPWLLTVFHDLWSSVLVIHHAW